MLRGSTLSPLKQVKKVVGFGSGGGDLVSVVLVFVFCCHNGDYQNILPLIFCITCITMIANDIEELLCLNQNIR
jgi:hypothetical protein